MFNPNVTQMYEVRSEPARELDAARLRRIATELAQMSQGLSVDTSPPSHVADHENQPATMSTLPSVETLRTMIRHRRLRDKFFSPELFADPAWDMMLDLLAARLEYQQVSVSSLSIAAAVPATTALRWIAGMTEQGILTREKDPHDGRRFYVGLSETAMSGLSAYFTRTGMTAAQIA